MSESRTNNKMRLYEEAYRLSEQRMNSQLTSALAADARAVSFAGLSIASAAILCGLSKDASAPWALLLGSILLVLAAFFSGYSARPVDFFMPGAHFSDLEEDIEKNLDFIEALRDLGKFNDEHTKKNEKILNSNANALKVAFVISLLGLIIAILPQIAF